MNDRIRGVHQAIIFVAAQTKPWVSQVSAEDAHLGLQVLEETRKIQVQLQSAPQAQLRFLRIARAHQHVQSSAMCIQQIGGNMRADISG